jgi:electron transport complex protein RnfB
MPETGISASAHVAAIDHYLPQTQCTQCGYPSCKAYAQAISDSKASINRCPPGSDVTIRRLATLLNQCPIPLDPECGPSLAPQQAFIVEAECIGCTLCIQACPVDAIVGAAKMMHTVIVDECTGCRLCVDPCPVACISIDPAEMPPNNESSLWPGLSSRRVLQARERFHNRHRRLQRRTDSDSIPYDRGKMHEEILASVERVRQRRSNEGLAS